MATTEQNAQCKKYSVNSQATVTASFSQIIGSFSDRQNVWQAPHDVHNCTQQFAFCSMLISDKTDNERWSTEYARCRALLDFLLFRMYCTTQLFCLMWLCRALWLT